LLRHSHPYAYKYRRSSLEFKIGRWNPKAFVAGINKVAEIVGPNPHVQEAYVKSFRGDIEELIPFYDQRTFCEHVGRSANLFGELVFQIRARSITVGIAVPSDHKKLRIRTSLPPDDVDKLIDAWPSELKLDQTKADDTGAFIGGSAPSATESPWLKYGTTILTAFVTAASISGVITLKKAIWPEYKVSIVSPIVQDGKAKLIGTEMVVDWYLQPTGDSFLGIDRNSVAVIRIMGPSGIVHEVRSKAPVSMPIQSGDYTLLVDIPDIAPVGIQLHIDNVAPQETPGKK
jgi:hypothetical protein